MIARDRLIAELSSYLPGSGLEAASLARIRDLVSRAADPFTRELPDHVTASTVVARRDGSAFLLVHHRRLDRWLQPGGHAEAQDDSVCATALREAREETGISRLDLPLGDRIFDVDVHRIPALRDRPLHVHYDLRFLATTDEDPSALAADEVRDARWFTMEEALATGADESLARALRKARVILGRPPATAANEPADRAPGPGHEEEDLR